MLLEDQAIDEAWKAGQIELAERHIALLNRTSTRMIGIGDDRHMLTGAGSRSGKGTSTIITNLCLYPGSVLCIDPKGENARLTATRRGKGSAHCEGMGQKTIILDPYNVSRIGKDQRGSCQWRDEATRPHMGEDAKSRPPVPGPAERGAHLEVGSVVTSPRCRARL